MARKTNSIERFWQELKRRKVFGVVTTYAATAYIIIEVTNNLVEPLSLPAWIAKLVILLLGAGLPIVAILSWIFDFTPQGIKKTVSIEESESKEIVAKPVKRRLRPSYILNAILIIAVIILAWPKIFRQDTIEKLRSSGERITVAAMPFQNMTNDTTWNVWQDGIQANLIASLTNSKELKVRQTETTNNLIQSKSFTNYASITPSIARNISQELDADVFIYGNINQSGSTMRLNAQIVDSKTEDALKSFQIDGTAENILHVIDSLSVMVKNFLIITVLEKEITQDFRPYISTNYSEAYSSFILGQRAYQKRDFPTATKWYLLALRSDTGFAEVAIWLSSAYSHQGLYNQAKELCLKVYEKKDQLRPFLKTWADWLYAVYFETPNEEIKYLRQILEFDDQQPLIYYILGYNFNELYQYDKAIVELEKALEIYEKWGSKPFWINNYQFPGICIS